MKTFYAFILFIAFSFTMQAQSEFPSIDLNTLNGKTKNSKEIVTSKDKVTIVSMWATWCVPCLKELDAINEVYEDWQDETGVELVAISVDDSRTVSRVRPMINGKDWPYEVLLDTNNDLKRALGAATVPLTLILKGDKIVYRHSGYSPGAEHDLFEKVRELSN